MEATTTSRAHASICPPSIRALLAQGRPHLRLKNRWALKSVGSSFSTSRKLEEGCFRAHSRWEPRLQCGAKQSKGNGSLLCVERAGSQASSCLTSPGLSIGLQQEGLTWQASGGNASQKYNFISPRCLQGNSRSETDCDSKLASLAACRSRHRMLGRCLPQLYLSPQQV